MENEVSLLKRGDSTTGFPILSFMLSSHWVLIPILGAQSDANFRADGQCSNLHILSSVKTGPVDESMKLNKWVSISKQPYVSPGICRNPKASQFILPANWGWMLAHVHLKC